LKKTQRFDKLFQPGRIGSLEIRNRTVMAPMGTGFAELDGRFSQQHIDYFVARAKGGTGLILTEPVLVETKISPIDRVITYMDSDSQISRACDLVDAVHDYGAKIGVQLSPGSGRTMPGASPENVPVSASAVPSLADPNVLCRELSVGEIKTILRAYGDAAERILLAGFDIIEIHAHNGYLIDQFMTSLWNKRSDEYGGDLEGRMRFAIEIVEAIRSRIGRDFPLSFRYAGDHKIEGGRTLKESQKIAQLLEAAGVNVLHIDAGCHETQQWMAPPIYYPEGCIADLAVGVKQAVNIPVITVGSIMSPAIAEEILNKGNADFVCLGRGLLADPDWPNKAREGRVEDIRPCIRCLEGCTKRRSSLKTVSCSVNPCVGKERYYAITRAERPKNVMVIGGGPAGMEAARVAALKGHKVTLFEKEMELGGQLRAASKPSFKSPLADLVDYFSNQLKKLRVRIIRGKEVTLQLISREKPEAVVLAAGAVPSVPSIPGIENKKVITAVDLLLGKKRAGDEVIVLGAALVGCDTALFLAQKGKKVTIIKIRPGTEIAEDLYWPSKVSLLEELSRNKVTILTNLTIKELTDGGVVAADKDGTLRTYRADTIVLALGAKSEEKMVENLKDKVSELYIVGDCANPRKIGEAIHEGFVAGWRV
jgi:2-enoate reductase